MKGISAVVFDLDDTLFNEIDYIKSGYDKIAKYLEKECLIDKKVIYDLLIKQYEKDKNLVIDRVLRQLEINDKIILNKCLDIYRDQKPDIKLEQVTRKLLLDLKVRYTLGMITDGRPVGQRAKIQALDLENIIEHIVITDELWGKSYRKPHPRAYEYFSSKSHIDYPRIVYIGDNIKKDFVAANRLGIRTIQYLNKEGLYYGLPDKDNEYSPYYKVKTLEEIRGVLEKI